MRMRRVGSVKVRASAARGCSFRVGGGSVARRRRRARARGRRGCGCVCLGCVKLTCVVVFTCVDNMIQIRKDKREEAMLKKRRCVWSKRCDFDVEREDDVHDF
jgi:hypothetical protein